MKNILITGGAGFIGSHLCEYLVGTHAHITCMDNLSTGTLENIQPFLARENFTFIEGDVIDNSIFGSLGKVDEIYHLACPASPKQYQKDPIKTLKTSILGSMNVLELCREKKARVLLSSTSEVYGDPLVHPQNESYWGNVNPIGVRACYDEGKRCAETIFMDYQRVYGVNVGIVRIFNTYGPRMQIDDGRVISNFITQALQNEPITLYGDGLQTRSLQYIDDLVVGLVKMMESGLSGPINLGSTDELSIQDIATVIVRLIPESKSKFVYVPLPTDDPKRRKPDITLAKEQLSWEPRVTVELGIKKTIDYFASR